MLQVIAFLAMEPPRSLDAEAFRDEKVKLLRAMRPIDPADVVRGQYDGYRQEEGVDPKSQVETFVAARMWIDNWRWDGVPFVVADNMTHREDGLIGNALFQDKVVEIDYDRMVIAVHETLPALSPGWHEEDMILDGVVPFVRGTLSVGDSVREGWFMVDTGAYTSILNSDRLSAASKMVGELRRLLWPRRWRHSRPAVTVGGHTFGEINFSSRRYDGDASALGLLGNDILKRFNLIVDNQHGHLYFRANGQLGAPFRNPEYYLVRGMGAVSLAIGGAVWFSRRRTRLRRGLQA
jgi:hypothetical protein